MGYIGVVSLGPIVLSLDRAYAGLGFLVLLLGAELLARRGRPEVAAWAWRAAIAAFIGARLGFVLANGDFYLGEPLAAFAVWQGGFSPWWGVAAAVALTIVEGARTVTVRRAAPALGIVALLAWLVPSGLMTPSPRAVDLRLPDLTLETLDGQPVYLADGGPLLVNVWATWCPPCRRELPMLLREAEGAPDVRLLLVSQGEARATVAAYLERHGLGREGVLLDRDGAVGAALRVGGLPTTFAFDGDGRLVDAHVGEISAPGVRRLMGAARDGER